MIRLHWYPATLFLYVLPFTFVVLLLTICWYSWAVTVHETLLTGNPTHLEHGMFARGGIVAGEREQYV